MPGQARAIDLAGRRQNAHGDGQIKPARILGQVGRGQVDGDAFVLRKLQARVLNRRAHPLPSFFHLDIRQAHQGETGQAIAQMHLDRDGSGAQAQQGTALNEGKAHT